MKTLKDYLITENKPIKTFNLGTSKLIENWLNEHDIKNYTINSDMTINVDGDVELDQIYDNTFPKFIKFKYVSGNFSCSDLHIKSLKGSPEKVDGNFTCSYCSNIISLEGSTQEVGGDFNCSHCENLTSLKGSPKKINKHFDCTFCFNLTSLEGGPQEIYGDFDGFYNSKNFTKDDVIKICNVKGDINV